MYRFCGHATILKKYKDSFQNTDYVLKLFAKKVSTARRRYRKFVEDGISFGRRPELVGGGLIHSLGGCSAVKEIRKADTDIKRLWKHAASYVIGLCVNSESAKMF